MRCLWDHVANRGGGPASRFFAPDNQIAVAALATASTFDGGVESLRGKSVLLATRSQLATAIALLELDGVAARIVLCTPELSPELLRQVASMAAADAVVVDAAQTAALAAVLAAVPYIVTPQPRAPIVRCQEQPTEWIVLTSGTTGMPKLVSHTLGSLMPAVPREARPGRATVWSTFYDIRRYGGLQIYLRAVLSGSDLVLSNDQESVRDFFTRAATLGVTHISGTPSHWRRVLMSGEAARLAPEYVRLSGEVADQALLDALRATYPEAQVSHAFASTEAGVAFEVDDGLAGFPAELLGERGTIDMKVEEGTLRIRSKRTATHYLGDPKTPMAACDGYVDTGDLIELDAGRYFFRGRKGGIINVGGLKVYPEEVEAVLNADSRVRMTRVRARRNPITGAVVVAEVVLWDAAPIGTPCEGLEAVKADLLSLCRRALAAHKVPTSLRFVRELELTAAGKMERPNA